MTQREELLLQELRDEVIKWSHLRKHDEPKS